MSLPLSTLKGLSGEQFVDQLIERFKIERSKIGLTTPDGQELSFEKIAGTIRRFESHLARHKIGAGHRVNIENPNYVVKLCLLLAVASRNATVVIGNTLAGCEEDGLRIDYVISNEVRPAGKAKRILFSQSWFEGPKVEDDYQMAVAAQHPMLICTMSGSTGHKKYIGWTAQQISDRIDLFNRLFGSNGNSCLVTLGIDANVGCLFALRALSIGGHYLRPQGTPARTLEAMKKNGTQELYVTSNILADLVSAAEQISYNVKPLERLVVLGAAVSRALISRAEKTLGPVTVSYGTTETGPVTTGCGELLHAREGVVGTLANWVDLQIVDAAGENVEPGTQGEIRIASNKSFQASAYLIAEKRNDQRSAIHDGWFYPGDLGVLSDDNVLTVTGRISDVINAGGNKIAPSNVETVACKFDEVRSACAFALRNENGADDIALAIVCSRNVKIDQIKKVLHVTFGMDTQIYVEQVDEIPLNNGGKPDRTALRALFAGLSK